MTEEYIREALHRILEPPLALFSLQVQNRKNHTLIEVSLDHIVHKTGSASLDDCTAVASKLNEELARSGEDFLYTLQVSSCGAERELRIPGDLERFRGLLATLWLADESGARDKSVYRILSVRGGEVELQAYQKGKKPNIPFFVRVDCITKGKLFLEI